MIPIDGESYWLGAREGVYEADTDCFRLSDGYLEPAALSAPQRASDPAVIEGVASRMRDTEHASYAAAYPDELPPDPYTNLVGEDMYGSLIAYLAVLNADEIERHVGRIYG